VVGGWDYCPLPTSTSDLEGKEGVETPQVVSSYFKLELEHDYISLTYHLFDLRG
jgi:hypothetical protein